MGGEGMRRGGAGRVGERELGERELTEEGLAKADGNQDGEGSEQNDEHRDGTFADGLCAAQVPCRAEQDDGKGAECPAIAGGEAGRGAAEVGDEDDRVDGHVEDAGGEREPRLLEAPEAAESAAYPAVVAALFRERGGQFADHECGGQAPDERDDEQQEQGAAVAGVADDVLQAVGAPGDHEVGRSDERKQPHFAIGSAHAQVSSAIFAVEENLPEAVEGAGGFGNWPERKRRGAIRREERSGERKVRTSELGTL